VYKLTDDVSKMVLEYLNVTGFGIELGALLFNSEINDSFKRDKAYKKREILLMQSKIANKRTEDLKYRKKIEPLPMVSENLLTPEDGKEVSFWVIFRTIFKKYILTSQTKQGLS